jgi:hypothetical protein
LTSGTIRDIINFIDEIRRSRNAVGASDKIREKNKNLLAEPVSEILTATRAERPRKGVMPKTGAWAVAKRRLP